MLDIARQATQGRLKNVGINECNNILGTGIQNKYESIVFLQTLASQRYPNTSIIDLIETSTPTVGNNVNSPIRTSAIGLLQHLQLLYHPS
jgi:hypothetical protein